MVTVAGMRYLVLVLLVLSVACGPLAPGDVAPDVVTGDDGASDGGAEPLAVCWELPPFVVAWVGAPTDRTYSRCFHGGDAGSALARCVGDDLRPPAAPCHPTEP